jgi:hypothetical protein
MSFDEYVAAVAGAAPALSDDQIEQVRRILQPVWRLADEHRTGPPEQEADAGP